MPPKIQPFIGNSGIAKMQAINGRLEVRIGALDRHVPEIEVPHGILARSQVSVVI